MMAKSDEQHEVKGRTWPDVIAATPIWLVGIAAVSFVTLMFYALVIMEEERNLGFLGAFGPKNGTNQEQGGVVSVGRYRSPIIYANAANPNAGNENPPGTQTLEPEHGLPGMLQFDFGDASTDFCALGGVNTGQPVAQASLTVVNGRYRLHVLTNNLYGFAWAECIRFSEGELEILSESSWQSSQ